MADPYVIFPGTAPNYVSTPDAPELTMTGDFDLEADIALPDYSNANQVLFDTQQNAGLGGILWMVNGDAFLVRVGDGSDTNQDISAPFTADDGERVTIRWTREVATGLYRYYLGGVEFDTGACSTLPGVGSGLDARVGRWLSAAYLEGNVYRVTLRDGIDGPVVAEFLASDIPVPAQLPT